MERRTFDHLYAEISVAMGCRASRFELWLAVWSHAGDPNDLSREGAARFVAQGLTSFLKEEGVDLDPRIRAKLERKLLRFDPTFPTPEEWVSRATDAQRDDRVIPPSM